MKKRYWWQSWSRFLLWSHVLSVIGFYLVLWLRTAPGKDDRVKKLAPKSPGEGGHGQGHNKSVPTVVGPMVSIIVPARDEELNIRRCVESLLEQDYDNYEVIVVDDGSTDNTSAILDEMQVSHPNSCRLWVLRLRDLPPGWAGKPHAVHSGTREARGEWLLFTDADTWHAPNALRSTITQAQEEGVDLFTLVATQQLPTFWEKVLMPMAFLGVSMLYPPKQVNDPASPVAVASGQYILIRREVYDTLGGYGRPELRGTLLDDRDLARLVKEHGFRLFFVDGCGLVSVRMYRNVGEIWRGWRKNAYLGNRGGLGFVLLQLVGLPMTCIVPFLLPLLAVLTRNRRGDISAKEASLATALELAPLLAYRTWLNKYFKVPWYYSLTHPLAGAFFEGILAESTWRVLSGKGVDWRGRQYHNGKAKKVSEADVSATSQTYQGHP